MVVFTGSGTTGAIHKLIHALQLKGKVVEKSVSTNGYYWHSIHRLRIGNGISECEWISLFVTSDVLKITKIPRAVGECNLKGYQNITSDHKSRNA